MEILIRTTEPHMHFMLSEGQPAGVRVPTPPLSTKGFDCNVAVNIALNLDLNHLINTGVFVTWLFSRLSQGRGKTEICLDGQYIPIDQPNTPKLIEDAINQNKS